MLIVSQDERDIVNFDFTQRVGLDRENNFTSINVYQNGNASAECMLLGTYDTEERAKEVLREIRKTYYDENCEFENGMYRMQRTYEMQKNKKGSEKDDVHSSYVTNDSTCINYNCDYL